MLTEVFTYMVYWFFAVANVLQEHGGYLGVAIFIFPLLRKVCYVFKQLTN